MYFRFCELTPPPFPQIDIIGATVIVWRAEGKSSGLFCAVLCAIVHSELHAHMNRTNSSLDWVLSHWAHLTVLRFIFVYVLFCVWLYIACICRIVTWWGEPGGIEAWGPLLPSVLWHCWLGHVTRKTRPRYDLHVFSGTLNPTQSINQFVNYVMFGLHGVWLRGCIAKVTCKLQESRIGSFRRSLISFARGRQQCTRRPWRECGLR